jgi:hypothetical protein
MEKHMIRPTTRRTPTGPLLGLMLGLAGAATGCDTHVDPLEPEVQLASRIAPATEGAWAECRFAEGDESGWSRSVCPEPTPEGEERACSTSYVSELQEDDSVWCEVTALCNYECDSDAACPTPQSGDVVPVCNYVCQLPCDGESQCPDGMTCHHEDHGDGPKDLQGFCRYVYNCE